MGVPQVDRTPRTRLQAFHRELLQFVMEPDAQEWLYISAAQASVNGKYWAESARRFAMGEEEYHRSLDKDSVRRDLLWLWRRFRREQGGFAQVDREPWSSIFASVYAIRVMRVFLWPRQEVSSRTLLGSEVLEQCRGFVRDLWRDGTFIDGKREGTSRDRSLTKLYYAITLLNVLADGKADDTLTADQWNGVLRYVASCVDHSRSGIGFKYQPDPTSGGWVCTTYYAVRLLRMYQKLCDLDGHEFAERLGEALGMSAKNLETGIRLFLEASWEANQGCRLAPHRTDAPTLNHTYMYVSIINDLLGFGGGGDPPMAELPAILRDCEGPGGGYALYPGGVPNIASTYVATRLWQDLERTALPDAAPDRPTRNGIKAFVERCCVVDDGGSRGFTLIAY